MSYGFGHAHRRAPVPEEKETTDGGAPVKGRLEQAEKIHRIFQGQPPEGRALDDTAAEEKSDWSFARKGRQGARG